MNGIIDNSDFITTKNSSVKNSMKRIRRQASEWGKYMKMHLIKDSLPKKYKEPSKLNGKKINNPPIMGQNLTKVDIQMSNKHTKDAPYHMPS